ncbi:MAG: DUF4416 family protein [Nitrospirae bacterium]|nr:DUF4416 family protein [Nitrospirota bacterium]
MGTPHPPEASLLFISLLFSRRDMYSSVMPLLVSRFGNVLLESDEFSWNHTHYYDGELGTPVYRKLLFFGEPFDPLALPDIKLETNRLEASFALEGKRRVNIDPGYIMRSRVVLASAKDYSHRIYLGKGIYGEVELYYQGNQYNPLPYTYYDYRDLRCLDLFKMVRKELRRKEGKQDIR